MKDYFRYTPKASGEILTLKRLNEIIDHAKKETVFSEFDKDEHTYNWWQGILMRLQPWKWRYLKEYGAFIRRT